MSSFTTPSNQASGLGSRPRTSSKGVALWQGAKGSSNGRLRRSVRAPGLARRGAPQARLDRSIEGLEEIEEEEQRVELIAASERCEALANSLTSWLGAGRGRFRLLDRAGVGGHRGGGSPWPVPRSTSAQPSAATSSTGCPPAS